MLGAAADRPTGEDVIISGAVWPPPGRRLAAAWVPPGHLSLAVQGTCDQSGSAPLTRPAPDGILLTVETRRTDDGHGAGTSDGTWPG